MLTGLLAAEEEMDAKRAAVQLRAALGESGLSLGELARRTEMDAATVAAALGGARQLPAEHLEAVGHALDLELAFVPTGLRPRIVGEVRSVVDNAIERLAPERIVQQVRGDAVLALGIVGTLVGEGATARARPGLLEFLECCRGLFARIVVIADDEGKFRETARALVEEGAAPGWFAALEVLGDFAELLVAKWAAEDALLEVGEGGAAHPGQVRIARYECPYDQHDSELMRVLEELVQRLVACEAEREQAAVMVAQAALQGLDDVAVGRTVDDPMMD